MKRDYFPIIPVLFFLILAFLTGLGVYLGGIYNTQPQFAGTTSLNDIEFLILCLLEIPAILMIIFAFIRVKKIINLNNYDIFQYFLFYFTIFFIHIYNI